MRSEAESDPGGGTVNDSRGGKIPTSYIMNDMSVHLWTMYILVLLLILNIPSPPKLVITRGDLQPQTTFLSGPPSAVSARLPLPTWPNKVLGVAESYHEP